MAVGCDQPDGEPVILVSCLLEKESAYKRARHSGSGNLERD